MGVMKIVKKSITAGWNVSAWVGLNNIKNNAVLIKDLSKSTFTQPYSGGGNTPKKETFAQAMRRLNITEAGLQKRIKSSTHVILFCGILFFPMLIYTVYMFQSNFYLSSFVCLMLTALLGAYCFREHFNRYQMRQRRLGCTVSEWARDLFRLNPQRKK